MAVFWVTRRAPVTHLRKLMLEELQRRNYSQTTARAYLLAVRQFRRVLPPTAGSTGPRSHPAISVLSSAGEKAQPPFRRATGVGATILLREDVEAALHIPFPKVARRLPIVLSQEEVGRLIDSASNLLHRTMPLTLYSTGIRRAELCRLQVCDIDSQRKLIHIRAGKGDRDRDVPLSPKLLETLREYWRWMKPKTYLFPGTVNNWRADVPISDKIPWHACREAAQRAGITKHVSPHTLRHSWATHLHQAGADLRTIQVLLGHAKLEHTIVYLHLSQKHLTAVANPLDTIKVSSPDGIKRSRKKQKP